MSKAYMNMAKKTKSRFGLLDGFGGIFDIS